MWFTPTGSLANGDEHMRDTSTHDNPSATGTLVDDGPGNPFMTSHLPWNLEFDPAMAPTTTRVDLGEPWVVGCRVRRRVDVAVLPKYETRLANTSRS